MPATDVAHLATRVLLVEDDPVDAKLVQEALAGSAGRAFQVEWVTQLRVALLRLSKAAFDVVLLDLTLPDGLGITVFDQIFEAAPRALILVLSGASDEELACQAVQRGAQDYFAKGHIDARWLPHALRYVMERKASQDALRDSEERFRAMSDASPLGIFVSDAGGDCIYTNAAYHKISGLNFAQALGTNWSMAIHPDDRQRIVVEWRDAVRGHEPFQAEVRFLREDGSIVWTRLNAGAMRDGLTSRGRVQTVEDITGRKTVDRELALAKEALFEEKERAQVTLNSIGDAVLCTDILGNVTYLNPVAETMTGWKAADALGRPLGEVFRIIDGITRQPADNPAQRAIAENKVVGLAVDSVLIRRDGVESAIEDSSAPIHNRDGRVSGAVIVFHDVSEARAMAQKMAHLARHDFLTTLPNRLVLTERLSWSISHAQRHHKQVALLFLDLDNFKDINDELGHVIGDRLLQSVAGRLLECVRSTDSVFRQGGDEFVILLDEIERRQDAAQVAEKLVAAQLAPHRVEGHDLHVTLSIGISIYPDDGLIPDALMKNADTAMYCAKANGRNNYQFFTAEMNSAAAGRRGPPSANQG
ncbi:MAG: diguanylate cyclase [Dechloromonas sp.]|uniref:Diguanylate cyclase n=1 Tax=Candidatus Dechloromonas phosphorivorans TaxID=2899244 RepID=A0A9D7QLN9_9RHOO|nr:diguanylate cyclase [Candidatus Dechloromonas phosphorivorans]